MVLWVCKPEPCGCGDMCAVPLLLGVARQLAVGGAARRCHTLRDARDDVFAHRDACAALRDDCVVADSESSGAGQSTASAKVSRHINVCCGIGSRHMVDVAEAVA